MSARKIPIPKGFRSAAERYSVRQMAKKYRVSTKTVQRWLKESGIGKTGKAFRDWRQEDDERLRKLVTEDGLYIGEAALLLGRTPKAAMSRARKLGIRSQNYKSWSVEEEQELQRLAEAGSSILTAAKRLGRTEGAVRTKAIGMGLHLKRAADRDPDGPKNSDNGTLCWRCENAVPDPETGRGCSWSRRFEPVESWLVRRADLRRPEGEGGPIESYCVVDCPEFREG